MKKTAIAIIFISISLASCKKEGSNKSESSKLTIIGQKYHLIKMDTLVLKPTRSFGNEDEPEKYLSLRDGSSGPKTYSVDLAAAPKRDLEVNDSGHHYWE
jgi:hypothetical protein